MRLPATCLLLMFSLLMSKGLIAATLIHNVNGYTMENGARSQYVALEYDKGVVTHVYASMDEAALSVAETKIDGAGATLLPGLIDAHGHVSSYGSALANVDLNGAATEAEATQRVAEFIAQADMDSSSWVKGRGWNQVLWPEKTFPTRETLDAVAPIGRSYSAA